MKNKLGILFLVVSISSASYSIAQTTAKISNAKNPVVLKTISSENFYQDIYSNAPWILKNKNWNPEDLLTEVPRPSPNWNQYYQKNTASIHSIAYPFDPFKNEKDYTIDLKLLQKTMNTSDYLSAREKWFQYFPFNDSEGTFKYPYATLKYWDILPHPPIESLNENLSAYAKRYGTENEDSPLLKENAQKEIDQETQTELSQNNKTKLLNNREVYESLLKNLSETNSDVLASNMFMTCDASLDRLMNLIEQKIENGIKFSIIFDHIFALKYSKCFKKLKKMGVKISYSNDFFKIKNQMVYHSKFWIFDGKKAVVYGPNLLDAQVNSSGFNGLYRDSGLEIEGPVVNDLVVEYGKLIKMLKPLKPSRFKFIQNRIEEAEDNILNERNQKLRGTETLTQNGTKNIPNQSCRVVLQTRENRYQLTKLYNAIIKNTKNNLYLSRMLLNNEVEKSPYLESIYNNLLIKTSQPNFNLDITGNNWMTATDVQSGNYKKNDFLSKLYRVFVKQEDARKIVRDTREKLIQETESNFKVWHYFQYYHQKTMLADNVLSAVGSFNINSVSTDKSYEIAVVCYDKQLNQQMKNSIVLDLMNSIPLKSEQIK